MAESKARVCTVVSLLLALSAVSLATPCPARAALSAEMQKQLGETKYVYIQSERKDGSLGKAAEIWFFFHDGAVYVASRQTAWRVRRIKAGRKTAKIHAFMPSGPAFDAAGEIIKDPAAWNLLFEAYAKKYPEGWPTHGKLFRDGAVDGGYVLIRYTPK